MPGRTQPHTPTPHPYTHTHTHTHTPTHTPPPPPPTHTHTHPTRTPQNKQINKQTKHTNKNKQTNNQQNPIPMFYVISKLSFTIIFVPHLMHVLNVWNENEPERF